MSTPTTSAPHNPGPVAGESRPGAPAGRSTVKARMVMLSSVLVLLPVAGIGAVLSFRSLYEAAEPTFGPLTVGFPLLVDMLILGSSLAFLGGAMLERARAGWRRTAHAGVAATLLLNALAAPTPQAIPWHIVAPAVWSVLVEMSARQVTGAHHAGRDAGEDAIAARLWLSAPLETARTRRYMSRSGERSHREAGRAVAVNAAALRAARIAIPQRSARATRRLIARHLRAGSLTPGAVLRVLDWQADGPAQRERTAEDVERALLHEILNQRDAGNTPRRPHRPAPEPAAAETPPSAPEAASPMATLRRTGSRAGASARTRSRDLQDRQAAVETILRQQPDIDGPHLAGALAESGWKVSDRTATRALAAARADLCSEGATARAQ